MKYLWCHANERPVSERHTHSTLQRQTAVTAYLKNKQLLLFVFARLSLKSRSYQAPAGDEVHNWISEFHFQLSETQNQDSLFILPYNYMSWTCPIGTSSIFISAYII